jgi:hypothetical protein
MRGRYRVVAAAHRVVGVGSVGTRAYLVLLFGKGEDDPLFLQVKESVQAAHAPYLPPMGKDFIHNGRRVVIGQRALQASSDPMLGYTSMDGRDYYVRQMKNLKALIPIEWLTGAAFNFYAWALRSHISPCPFQSWRSCSYCRLLWQLQSTGRGSGGMGRGVRQPDRDGSRHFTPGDQPRRDQGRSEFRRCGLISNGGEDLLNHLWRSPGRRPVIPLS